jgi:hypothetical protein
MTTSESMDGVEQSRMGQGTRRKWINKYVSIAMFMSVRKQGIHGKEPKGREVGCERLRGQQVSLLFDTLSNFGWNGSEIY